MTNKIETSDSGQHISEVTFTVKAHQQAPRMTIPKTKMTKMYGFRDTEMQGESIGEVLGILVSCLRNQELLYPEISAYSMSNEITLLSYLHCGSTEAKQ